MTVTVKFYRNAVSSPAWGMIPFAIAELVGEGLTVRYSHDQAHPNDAMFTAFDGDIPIGFIVYRPDELKADWWVMLSYVDPSQRSQGVHTKLFEAVAERAKSKGDILTISCGTHVDNVAAQNAFNRHGRELTGFIYTFHVREAADGEAVIVAPEHIKAFMAANDTYRMKMFVDNEGVVTITLKDGSKWQMTSEEFDNLPGKYPI